MSNSPILLPREHGAWGMLLVPFVAAAILAGRWSWFLPIALIAVLIVFVLREPLIVLARQRWIWRDPHPETPLAQRTLAIELPLLALCGALLISATPITPLLLLGSLAATLTITAVWMTIKNRQRSVLLQIASAFGLGSSALLVALVASGTASPWAWWLWIFVSLHALAGVLVVHARLDHMASQRNPRMKDQAQRMRRIAIAMQAVQLLFAAGAGLAVKPAYAVPCAFSAIVFLFEFTRINRHEPLKRVGFRALSVSIVHAIAAIVVLG